ncbi:hypothetical protein [Evansella cellulosilytica]|uniref:Uncharacterized protein n=1 Tax=Evansella cellulosilytica (strain ATCC 21833 / DSM 2522 / FERM P-1141 / JCM 9156 / N-4) TaxID=649639 RepID=E6TUH6_EVAC2|nr:hypothetical protein [Evansella cellulosilytica]ADU29732.1 hypothetical protein Bcell_1469 [Evansella cellulosilytica DSM 2522]
MKKTSTFILGTVAGASIVSGALVFYNDRERSIPLSSSNINQYKEIIRNRCINLKEEIQELLEMKEEIHELALTYMKDKLPVIQEKLQSIINSVQPSIEDAFHYIQEKIKPLVEKLVAKVKELVNRNNPQTVH